jgi:branched-chain amino acid transport system permease protein
VPGGIRAASSCAPVGREKRRVSLHEFGLQLLNGVTFGAVLFIVSSGFTLIFGLMRIVNLAQGALYLIGGYIGLSVIRGTGSFILGVIVGATAIAAIGFVIERGLLRLVRGKPMSEILLTVGLSFIAADLALAQWGGDPVTVPAPEAISGSTSILGITYPVFRLVVLGLAVVLAALLWWLQERTRVGAIVRAGVDDREMVSALGINIPIVFAAAFFIGALLAGFGGALGGTMLSLQPGEDASFLLNSLIVVIIGGMGSLGGAAIGALLLGLVDAYADVYLVFGDTDLTNYSILLTFGLLVAVLAVRPLGLFGRPA